MVQPLWKTFSCFLTKLNILLLYNPATVLLGIYSKELKTYVHRKTCIQTFIAALFIIAQAWKQPRYHSIDEWINKQWHSRTWNIYYPVPKRSKPSNHEKTWRNLKFILLSERSQCKKATIIWFQCNSNWKIQNYGHSNSWAPKSLQMVTAAMKLKDTCSLEEKLWPT